VNPKYHEYTQKECILAEDWISAKSGTAKMFAFL